jgi:hypothetical protein
MECGPDAHGLADRLLGRASMQDSYADWMTLGCPRLAPPPAFGHTPPMRTITGRHVSETDVG